MKIDLISCDLAATNQSARVYALHSHPLLKPKSEDPIVLEPNYYIVGDRDLPSDKQGALNMSLLLRTVARSARPSPRALALARYGPAKRHASSYQSDLGGLTDEQLEVRVIRCAAHLGKSSLCWFVDSSKRP